MNKIVILKQNQNSPRPDRRILLYFESFSETTKEYLHFSNYIAAEYNPGNWSLWHMSLPSLFLLEAIANLFCND